MVLKNEFVTLVFLPPYFFQSVNVSKSIQSICIYERIVNTRSSEKSLLKCRVTKKHFNSKGMRNLHLVTFFLKSSYLNHLIRLNFCSIFGYPNFCQNYKKILDPVTFFISFKIKLNIEFG